MLRFRTLAIAAMLPLVALTACQPDDAAPSVTVEATSGDVATTTVTADTGTSAATSAGTSDAASATEAVTTASTSGAAVEVLAANAERHDDADDASWDAAEAVTVTLTGDTASADGDGVTIDGATVTITQPGTYVLSGSLDDGQVVVSSDAEGKVRLVLDGVDLHSSTGSPLAILAADEVVVVLAEGSDNRLSDEASYTFPEAGLDEPNATLFSAADLTIAGTGSLTVEASYNDGIASKDGLVIQSGTISVEAVDDGIRGKDYVAIDGGTVTVAAGGQAIKSDNDEDATKGWISVAGGTLDLTSEGDGLHASTDIVILGGAMTIATGDDGVHADASLTVGGGTIEVVRSYEGLESAAVTIDGGDITVTSSDDGVNAAGGVDGSGLAGGDSFAGGSFSLNINGGTIVVDAGGDGLDVNGPIAMTGGTVLVNGPTEQMNGPLDYDGNFDISGGVLVATGSAGMAMAPSTSSAQQSLLATFSTQAAGTLVRVESTDGTEIVTFQPTKAFASIAVSTPAVDASATYEVSVGGTSTGTLTDGVMSAGDDTGGTVVATTTSAEAVGQGFGPGGGGGRPGRP